MKSTFNLIFGTLIGLVVLIVAAMLLLVTTLLPYIGVSLIMVVLIGAYLYDKIISKEG